MMANITEVVVIGTALRYTRGQFYTDADLFAQRTI